jgi:hypothetical protein
LHNPDGLVSHRRSAAAVLLVAALMLPAGCGSGGKLGAKALAEQSKTLRSEAAEGALLARDAVDGKSTRIYVREHSGYLAKAAKQAESSLVAATTEPALEPKLRRLARLAARIDSSLQSLGDASANEQRTLERELRAAAAESQKIGQSLQ